MVSMKVTSFDKARRKKAAELDGMVDVCEKQPAVPETVPKKNKIDKKENTWSGRESNSGKSSRETGRPSVNREQEERSLRAV